MPSAPRGREELRGLFGAVKCGPLQKRGQGAVARWKTRWFVLHEDGDLDAAGALEDATVVALPVLYVILNAVLFGVPMLKACCHDMSCCSHAPRNMSKERKFIPWKRIKKVNPWAADLSGVQVQGEEAEEESEEARVSTATANKGSASGPFTALRRQHSSGARRSAKQLI